MLKSTEKISSIDLIVQFIRHKDGVIAYAPALDLSTVGKTLKKAQSMFSEAVTLFFDDLVERGNLSDVLSGLGWAKRRSLWIPPQPIKEKSISFKVPALIYS